MTAEKFFFPQQKSALHARSLHKNRYDFEQLIATCPELALFVTPNRYHQLAVDFADPAAVRMLNKALLQHFYGIQYWTIPPDYLCPAIPGRADYVHYLADLLASINKDKIPQGNGVKVLDIGIGASGIYPIIGHASYGWHFVGSDIDPVAIASAQQIFASNLRFKNALQCRLQTRPESIFNGIIKADERFDAILCNPPFHCSAQQAAAGSSKKVRNLSGKIDDKPRLNFGGLSHELWCDGGEERFVSQMIEQSVAYGDRCCWFTSLIAKKTTLPAIYQKMAQVGVAEFKTVNMAQGQKTSRFIAWTFLNPAQQKIWSELRWGKFANGRL